MAESDIRIYVSDNCLQYNEHVFYMNLTLRKDILHEDFLLIHLSLLFQLSSW